MPMTLLAGVGYTGQNNWEGFEAECEAVAATVATPGRCRIHQVCPGKILKAVSL